MKNNIFKFATSELSQDALICWCVNWINDETSPLFPMASEMLKLFGVNENPNCFELVIYQQRYNIDILLLLKGINKMVIIEDKTYSSEHGEQIALYKEKIHNISNDVQNEYCINTNVEIKTVYFKTGFFYDYDRKVKSDVVVHGIDFLILVEQYRHENVILDYYCDYLRDSLDWFTKYGKFDEVDVNTNFWDWNVSKYQIAQYQLMRDIFSEAKWDKKSSIYEVTHGSNIGGRPWTELDIMKGTVGKANDVYSVFWRIDTDSVGPYISLRLYDKYDKNVAQEKSEHIALYDKHRAQVEKIIVAENLSGWQWEVLKGGYTRDYYEATLMTFHLTDALSQWNIKSHGVIENINRITECFLKVN